MSADQACRVELKGAKFAHVIGSADALLAACVVEDLSISGAGEEPSSAFDGVILIELPVPLGYALIMQVDVVAYLTAGLSLRRVQAGCTSNVDAALRLTAKTTRREGRILREGVLLLFLRGINSLFC
jgi:hypothetical protein